MMSSHASTTLQCSAACSAVFGRPHARRGVAPTARNAAAPPRRGAPRRPPPARRPRQPRRMRALYAMQRIARSGHIIITVFRLDAPLAVVARGSASAAMRDRHRKRAAARARPARPRRASARRRCSRSELTCGAHCARDTACRPWSPTRPAAVPLASRHDDDLAALARRPPSAALPAPLCPPVTSRPSPTSRARRRSASPWLARSVRPFLAWVRDEVHLMH